jgi:hypothetical protein
MSFPRRLGALLIAVSLVGGCGQVGSSTPGCKKDSECTAGSACVVGACVPRIDGTPQTWAVELLPKTETNYAETESTAVIFSAADAQLKVEAKTMIKGDIMDVDASSAKVPTMRVLLSIPSTIGNGTRQFEGEASPSPDDMTHLRFAIGVPASAVGRGATLTLFPVAPLDQSIPVWSVPLTTLGPTVVIGAPKATDLSQFEGLLTNELDDPVVGWVARALIGDQLVSSVVKTDSQGHFKGLKIPNTVDLTLVRVELAPPDNSTVKPRLETTLIPMKFNLGVLRLPPVPNAQVLDIPVTSQGMKKPLPGVTLRFSAVLPKAVGGTASLSRDFQTDKDGVAHVTLLPGLAGQPREYAVAVAPPPNSEFAAKCFPSYAIATVPAGQARIGASIDLGNKLEVTGVVSDAAGAPQSGVIMTAIRLAGSAAQDCGADVISAPATVTTGADGSYRLALDPGRYRIEYEPSMGSASSLFVESDVPIDKSAPRHVTLPGGVLATGVVLDAIGQGVVGCEVRLFGRPAGTMLPELRARARTSLDGHFTIVLPQSP